MIITYKLWHEYLRLFPKTSRYSLGEKVDTIFVEIIEITAGAVFLSDNHSKQLLVRKAISKLDVFKILLQIAWEIKSLDGKKYIALSELFNEIGCQLGGWHNKLLKQNSPDKNVREK